MRNIQEELMRAEISYSRRRWKGDLSQMDPITGSCLKLYALNLLGRYGFTSTFLGFVLILLNRESRQLISERIAAREPEKDPRRASRALDYDRLADRVVSVLDESDSDIKQDEIAAIIRKLLAKNTPACRQSSKTEARLAHMQEIFGLTDTHMKVVCFLHCYRHFKPFENFCDGHTLAAFISLVGMATGLKSAVVKQALSAKGPLISGGIVDRTDGCIPLSLDSEVSDYLAGLGSRQLGEKYYKKCGRNNHDLASYPVDASSVDIIRALLKTNKPGNILLYGQAGAGKTEFAKSIIAAVGGEAYFVQYGEPSHSERHSSPNRRLAIRAATGSITTGSNKIIVIDEADQFLNTRYFMFGSRDAQDKGWLNEFLDNSKHRIIWICNETDFIEESTLRRFSYSLRFHKFTRRERQNIWQKLAMKHPLRRFLSSELLKELSAHYSANAAGIAAALTTLKTILPSKTATQEKVRETLANLLERHLEATGHNTREKLNQLTDSYDITALNTDVSPAAVMDSLKHFAGVLQGDNGKTKHHVNLLFWGLPGTGKTEFAKYVADNLSLGLMVKRASDLVSKWVGETEHNIRDAFEEAERDRSILFIDEADSMFINRETAMRSWETSQTNELLTQMENFRGILICCTNLLDNLDHAAMRRFTWKVQFKPLTLEGRVSLFSKYFNASPDDTIRMRLSAVEGLTPGDINNVWQKHRYTGSKTPPVDQLITELDKEVRYRRQGRAGSGIGFDGN